VKEFLTTAAMAAQPARRKARDEAPAPAAQ